MKDIAAHPTLVRIWRFGLVGFVATLVHAGVGMGLHHGAGMSPLWANFFAFTAAVVVSFVGQSRLTFPEATADRRAFGRFVCVALFGLGLNQVIVGIVTGPFGQPYWVGLALVVTTVPVATYNLMRLWAFRD